MNRNPNRICEVRNTSFNSLANPPRCVCRELVPFGEIKLLDCLGQAEIAILDQIKQRHPSAGVPFGDGDDEPQIGRDHLLMRCSAVCSYPLKVMTLSPRGISTEPQDVVCKHARLDALRDFDLVRSVEQWKPSDLLQVEPDKVIGVRNTSKHLVRFIILIDVFEQDKLFRYDIG